MQVGLFSGGQVLFSGNPWSGHALPQAFVMLRWDRMASGNLYVALSGGMTINSGGTGASGGNVYSGLLDGMQLGPGDVYTIPKTGTGASGTFNVFCSPDAAASGNRLYYEVFSLLLAFGSMFAAAMGILNC